MDDLVMLMLIPEIKESFFPLREQDKCIALLQSMYVKVQNTKKEEDLYITILSVVSKNVLINIVFDENYSTKIRMIALSLVGDVQVYYTIALSVNNRGLILKAIMSITDDEKLSLLFKSFSDEELQSVICTKIKNVKILEALKTYSTVGVRKTIDYCLLQ